MVVVVVMMVVVMMVVMVVVNSCEMNGEVVIKVVVVW